jgi:hypothetical protein
VTSPTMAGCLIPRTEPQLYRGFLVRSSNYLLYPAPIEVRSRDGRRSPAWRPLRRDTATNRMPGVKGVMKKRIEIEAPGSQELQPFETLHSSSRAEGIPETGYEWWRVQRTPVCSG